MVIHLDPPSGVHQPAYRLAFYKDGDPLRPITRVSWDSVLAIQTSKSVVDLSGTFTITLKDARAQHEVREMDTGIIRLRGHWSNNMITVLRVVVDRVRAAGTTDPHGGSDDTIIEGRCVAKYLQVTSLFLPVWDPEANLPTALTFGFGDATKKAGGNRPFDINAYLVKRFTYGKRNLAGASGIPNSRHWLDHTTRFSKRLGYKVPFLQFDEDSVATAFKRLEILGFTEAWVDELGRQVYRPPAWDAPVDYLIPTATLKHHDFSRDDVTAATYVEVVPAGDPGIDSATAQALRAGRAPVPSSYLSGDVSIGQTVNPEFVIDTNSKGEVTEAGKRNYWYQLQRRLGVRPQQVTSPLLFSQAQAQAQSEGLLRFLTRMVKGGTITIPGAPEVRLGRTARVRGRLDDGRTIDRTFYIEAAQQEYIDGQGYDTHLTLTHGRDPWDPRWRRMVLPRADPQALANDPSGGVLTPGGQPPSSGTPKAIIDAIALPIMRKHGLLTPSGETLTPSNNDAANALHTHLGSASDHAGPPATKWAVDGTNGSSPTAQMDAAAGKLARRFGIPWDGSGLISHTTNGYRYQLIYRYSDPQAGNHYNHIHFGVRVA